MERKLSRPRGATIGGASPLREATQERKKSGLTEEACAVTVHEELEFQDEEEAMTHAQIRASLSEDSLSQKLPANRIIV
ncbi:hypothetical protein HOP50_20g85340 [Chloropicon primus]|nr:hypothetical protein HOP50_20g85340 [Chloropicon primus]